MTIDIARVRAQTPGCANVVHLNNAGAALQPAAVTDAVVDHLRLEAAIGGYEAASAATTKVARTYDAIASLIGCDPSEVAVLESATRAWDSAFYSMALRPGDRLLTGRAEYGSNVLAMVQVAARAGARIELVDDDEHGRFDVEDLRRRLDDDTAGPVKLVAMTHVPTNGGLVNPAVEVGALTREAGVTYLLDACQSIGQLRIDVDEIGCDLLSATGRKFLRGPRGTGFLYASSRIVDSLDAPFPDLGSATWPEPFRYVQADGARRFENFEGSVAARIGLGVAVGYALDLGIEAIEERVLALASLLRAMLEEVPGVVVRDKGLARCGIVTFTVDGVASTDVVRDLTEQRINTTASLVSQAMLDLPERGLPDLVRTSVHYYNTEAELATLVTALRER